MRKKKIQGLYIHTAIQSEETGRLIQTHYAMTPGSQCFAENILAEQFIKSQDDTILKLSLESGELEFVCHAMDVFNTMMTTCDDANYYLAHSLRKEWESKNNHPLQHDIRLLPVIPFIAGGPFESGNLYQVPRHKALAFLIDFYTQTKNIQDGDTFKFKVMP